MNEQIEEIRAQDRTVLHSMASEESYEYFHILGKYNGGFLFIRQLDSISPEGYLQKTIHYNINGIEFDVVNRTLFYYYKKIKGT